MYCRHGLPTLRCRECRHLPLVLTMWVALLTSASLWAIVRCVVQGSREHRSLFRRPNIVDANVTGAIASDCERGTGVASSIASHDLGSHLALSFWCAEAH